jgi:hypothetical protein
VNDELGRMSVGNFKLLSQNLPREAKENIKMVSKDSRNLEEGMSDHC